VGTNPSLIAILPDLDTVFALVQGGSKVAIIQGVNLAATIDAGGSKPFGIAADPVFQRIFISHRDSGSLSVLRRENGAWRAFAGPKFTDNRQVFELAYHTATQRLFLVYARTIDGVDRWFLDVWEPRDVGEWGRFATQEIPSGGAIASPLVGGTGLEVNPSTGNLFVVNTGADSLTVIDGVTLGVVGTVVLGDDPFAVAINSRINEVYIGLRSPGRLIKLEDTY
jgi:YVTN family beta-propeller protein